MNNLNNREILSACFCLLALALPGAAQRGSPAHDRANGSTDPTRVSDELAFHHFFQTVAPPLNQGIAGPSLEEAADRQASYIEHVGFSPSQGEILIECATKYRRYIEERQERIAEEIGTPAPYRNLSRLEKRKIRQIMGDRNSFLRPLIAQLRRKLGPSGARILNNYIDNRVRQRVRFRGLEQE